MLFLTAQDLSRLEEVNVKKEAGVYSVGYDKDNPPRLIRFLVPGSADANGFTQVSAITDLPDPVAGVITLNGGAWLISHFLDLLGNRIEYVGDTAILGTSSETAGITSTGLTPGSALISGGASLPIQNLRLTVPTGCKAFSLTATGPTSAIDWRSLNILGGEVGTVAGFSNFIMQDSAFLEGAHGLVFDGSFGTIAFETIIFSLPAGTMITIPSTATITRRLRIIYSSFTVTSGNTGLSVSASANIPVEGYILDTVNFAGGGTYTTGVVYSDNKALFSNCRGINNSGEFAHMTLNGNATVTNIVTQGVAVKVAGTTVIQSDTQKFSHTNNRLTYTGAITRSFKVFATASISAVNSTRLGLHIAKGGSLILNSENYTTAGASNRSENALSQTVVSLATGEFVEVFVENGSSAADVTVTDMSVILEALN